MRRGSFPKLPLRCLDQVSLSVYFRSKATQMTLNWRCIRPNLIDFALKWSKHAHKGQLFLGSDLNNCFLDICDYLSATSDVGPDYFRHGSWLLKGICSVLSWSQTTEFNHCLKQWFSFVRMLIRECRWIEVRAKEAVTTHRCLLWYSYGDCHSMTKESCRC